MSRNLVLGLVAAALCAFEASNAAALTIDARIRGIYTDSTLSAPPAGLVIDGNGNATVPLEAGQFIVMDVIIDNSRPSGSFQPILVIGATLTFQGDQVAYQGMFRRGPILQEAGPGGNSLADIGSGRIKMGPGIPGEPSDIWLQALAYGSPGGVDGSGEQTAVISLAFSPTGATAGDQIFFEMGFTPGDEVIDPSGNPIPTTFSGATINVPEPGAALLLGLGLVGLGLVDRRGRSSKPSVSQPTAGLGLPHFLMSDHSLCEGAQPMRKDLVPWLVVAALAALATSNANALAIDVAIQRIYTDASLSSPISGLVIDGDGNAIAPLETGQVILISIYVDNSNPSESTQPIEAIFATLTFQGDQISYLGAIAPASILCDEGFGGSSCLDNLGIGAISMAPDPGGAAGDVWLQALAYGTPGGVNGLFVQDALIQYAFTVTGASAGAQIFFELGLAPGDSITDPSGNPIPTTFSGATINVPEPGAALLLGLGLVGLGSVKRRKR